MYDKLVLPNGVRIVSESMPYVRTAAIGIWVGVGSRFERAGENGAAHFIEHMLFKGTSNRTAAGLANIMDGIGGQINAFTSKESTCFYARVLETHLELAIDVLCDMFFDSLLTEADFDSERGVILEEIGMCADAPEDLVSERLIKKCFPGALGRPVLGTPKSLEGLSPEALRGFMSRCYIAPRIVVSLCGRFGGSHIRRLEEVFSRLPKAPDIRPGRSKYTPCFTSKRKAFEQNHLCLGFPGLALDDERRYPMSVLSSVLGGGMSSRLFQTVREKHGLCYSIYTSSSEFSDTGMFNIMTAVSRDSEEKALELILDELRRVTYSGVTGEELDRAREQTKAGILMALESTTAHMNRLGFGELALGFCPEPDELIAKYDAVTRDDVLAVARSVLDLRRLSLSAVGRVGPADAYAALAEKL